MKQGATPEFIRAGQEYHALLKTIRQEDGDRAWAELDRRKAAWVEASARLWEEMSAAPNDNPTAKKLYTILCHEQVIPQPWTCWQWDDAMAVSMWQLAVKCAEYINTPPKPGQA